MFIKKIGLTLKIILISCMIGLCFLPSQVEAREAKLETVVLQLKWFHQFQFAGYYAAVEKGFYRDAGLNVLLQEYRKELNIIEEVVSGAAQYGVGGSDILLQRIQGNPLVLLAALFQHSPVIVMSLKDSGIATPQDLIGRRLMWSPSVEAAIPAMLMNEGITFDQIKIIKPTWDYEDLVNGKADALAGYISNQPYFLEQKEIPINIIFPHKYGADFYGDCLFTTQREVKDHPERVKKFREASLKGWQYAMTHPGEVIDLILTKYGSKRTREHLRYEAQAMRDLILPKIIEIGHINPGRWDQIAKTYVALEKIDPEYSLDGFIYDPNITPDLVWIRRLIMTAISLGVIALIILSTLLHFNRRLKKSVAERTRELSWSNKNLANEIAERKRAEDALQRSHDELEKRVDERTRELMQSNERLFKEMEERKQMEYQIIQSEKLASLGFLVSGIAHEINNPNNFITFNIPILRDYLKELIPIIDAYFRERTDFELFGMPYNEFRQDLFKIMDNMEHGSSRINATVSGLREFVRKKNSVELKSIDLRQVIEKGVSLCRSKINRLVKSFEINVPDDLPSIISDPEFIEQILITLLINAAQATDKEDSWIKLNVSCENSRRDRLIIEISDNGCGMDSETQRKIFDPFFTTKSPGSGTGLGLSVSHTLVQSIRGRIEVESEPGQGSKFSLILTNDL